MPLIKLLFLSSIVSASSTHIRPHPYRQVSKSSLPSIPTWTTQIPTFPYLLDQIYQKYESVLDLTSRKSLSKDLRRTVASHLLGPVGMTQLTIHLHERLISPGIMRTDIYSFLKNEQDLTSFKSQIQDIISSLKQFQAFPPDSEDNNSENASSPELQTLLDLYTRKGSIFQKYPLESISIFNPLSHFIVAASNLEQDRFAHKKLLCGVRAAWDKYEKLGVKDRLRRVQVFGWDRHFISGHHDLELPNHAHQAGFNCTVDSCPQNIQYRNTSGDVFLVESPKYEEQGYGKRRRGDTLVEIFHAIENCSFKESEHFTNYLDQTKPSRQGFLCILDGTEKYLTHEKDGDYKYSQSLKTYLQSLRQGVEKDFRKMVNSLDPIKSHLADCHLSPAGSMEVTVVRAELTLDKGAYDKQSGIYDDESHVLPDPYVKIFVDEVEVGRTSVKNNTLTPLWMETFSVDKVYSWSDVRVEVFDQDLGEGDKDDGLGGVDLELVNVVAGLRDDFFSNKADIGFGTVTVGILYRPVRI
ncbi:uncharacterized protein LOC118433205 [Folsomia candida]|uniref:Phospholipase D gamma 1 n=1 Tax=Folsomia candida TaxID=158441 RepID=A0A226CZB4_FOLCA|nr:uncharacterized protein LOC118433205 [Folsomia candida]OXA38652.1 Phospholipase D gamma 1 [Folsomia candida]